MTSEIKVDTISEQTSANGVTIDGLTIKDGNIQGSPALVGTTPSFTIGDGGAEDTKIVFDGNALDYYIGLDDSADNLIIGSGSTVGSNSLITIDSDGDFTFDSAADITLDAAGNNIRLKYAGTQVGQFKNVSSDLEIHTTVNDKDMIFKGIDNNSEITALTLDMSDAGTATFNHDIKLSDSGALRLGDDGDAEIYHDGSGTVIRETSSGNLILAGNDVQVTNGAMNETHIDCNNNGSVDLYHNNVKKLETTADGISVSGLSVLTSNTPILKFIESDQSDKQYQIGSFGAAFAVYDQSNTEFRYIIDTNGNHVFNEGSADCDFRVESNGNANMLFVDGGGDRVYIGRNTSDGLNSKLQVEALDSSSAISIHRASADVAGSALYLSSSRGASLGDDTVVQDGDTLGSITAFGADGTDRNSIAGSIVFQVDGTPGSNDMPGRIVFKTTADGGVTQSERMRINSGGNLLIAQTTKETRGTTLYGTGGNNAFFTATGTNLYCKTNDGSSSTTGTFISFFNNSAATGSITCTNTTDTVYGGTSDYRLKENQTEINDGITKLKQLKPYDFNWKHDSSKKVQGFFAHEFAEICPNGVVGNKDATETKTKVILDANGGVINSNIEEDDWTMGKENGTYPSDSTWEDSKVVPIYQEMDASKAIPVLTAALKEAVTKIETLETEVTALKG